MTNRTIARCALVAVAGLSSSALAFNNGNFEIGNLSSWTISFTSGGATAVQDVQLFDIDGPGPLGETQAARFSAGRATGVTTGNHGVIMTQSLALTGGVTYTFDFDWAAWRPAGQGSNTQGGIFDLVVNGVAIASGMAGSTSGAAPKYGHVTGMFTPGANGSFDVGVMITRPFTIPTPTAPTLFQFVDNFTVSPAIPTPGAAALFAVAGLAGVRRRR